MSGKVSKMHENYAHKIFKDNIFEDLLVVIDDVHILLNFVIAIPDLKRK